MPPIPDFMQSVFEEGPFRKCVSCGAALDSERFYQIQKAWRNGEVVFEMAICTECAARTIREFSQESLERMQAFFEERFRETDDARGCNFCGKIVGLDEEYEMAAFCQGGFLARGVNLVCGTCSSASQENLSRQTRDSWGRFVEDNIPGVPHALELDILPVF